ncbi:MAG TPA: PspC domain-containing protein [Marmoricola sp.]|nr:PspC domain-containing protein [Marmoricola sp.]
MSQPETAAAWQPRRAYRATEESLLGGVAAGLARHLGVPPAWVRVAFLLLIPVGGLGVVLYGALWMFLPARRPADDEAPGLAAATRQGKRAGRQRRLADQGPLVALGAVVVGVLALVSVLTGRMFVVWPLILAGGGLAVLWWQADEAQRQRWRDSTSKVGPLGILGGGWSGWVRLLVGVALLVGAIMLFTLRNASLAAARDVGLAALLGVVGLALIVGPWLVRLSADLGQERAERIRSQERADVAAHLHDSVLQTLALIQRSAEDPATVARLARAQERDLRSWLYESAATDTGSFSAALRQVAAEVEDDFGVPVEVVCVGDVTSAAAVRPIVLAAREAMVNAAKHAGVDKVDAYAEVGSSVEVFVRDRGIGFDPAGIDSDRHGVRDSIMARMERHGGTAVVRSSPGEGTEVRLSLPRPSEGPAAGTTGTTSADSREGEGQ